jgi:hypothetical protein
MAVNIRILKLMSGEELLGDIKEDGDTVVAKQAVSIVYQQTEKGLGAGLAPFMPYAQEPVIINRHAIASSAEPNRDMLNQYNKIFGSGIVVAGADEMPEIKLTK